MVFKATTKDKVSFVWDFNDDSTTTLPGSITSHTNTIPERYIPKKSFFGCTSTHSIISTVNQPFKIKSSLRDTMCLGNSLNLFASGVGLHTQTPAIRLHDPASSRREANPALSKTYRVIGTDAASCFCGTAFVPVVVYPHPTVNTGEDRILMMGNTPPLNLMVSADVKSIKLQPPAGFSCTTCAAPIANPKQTTTYAISVSNQGWRLTKDDITVFVVCKEGNPFMPNTFFQNRDGINDLFYPWCKGAFTVKSFQVFTRWIEPVHERFASRQMTLRFESMEWKV